MHMPMHTQVICDGEPYSFFHNNLMDTKVGSMCWGGRHSSFQRAHLGLDLRDDLFYVSAQLPGHWLAQMPEFGGWN